mmetsp:Transcript_6719/g.27543  ORF Transcript_6719/g.27543 Transcript_6719/m.27543 type:complete len:241 (+) Transcript_6719:713-1435(+)
MPLPPLALPEAFPPVFGTCRAVDPGARDRPRPPAGSRRLCRRLEPWQRVKHRRPTARRSVRPLRRTTTAHPPAAFSWRRSTMPFTPWRCQWQSCARCKPRRSYLAELSLEAPGSGGGSGSWTRLPPRLSRQAHPRANLQLKQQRTEQEQGRGQAPGPEQEEALQQELAWAPRRLGATQEAPLAPALCPCGPSGFTILDVSGAGPARHRRACQRAGPLAAAGPPPPRLQGATGLCQVPLGP